MTFRIYLYLLLIIFLSGCSDNQVEIDSSYHGSTQNDTVVAEVGNSVISLGELDYLAAFGSSAPITQKSKLSLLEKMIEEEVLANEAKAAGFLDDPELKVNIRKLIAYKYRKYLEKKAAESVTVTNPEAEIYYRENLSSYTRMPMFRLAIVERRKDLDRKYTHTLKQILSSSKYVSAEDGFGQYALDSTHEGTRNRGGKLSWTNVETRIAGIPNKVIKEGVHLKVGESLLLEDVAGKSYLVRKIDERSEFITDFSDVESDIKTQLLTTRKTEMYERYLEKLKSNVEVKLYENRVKQLKDNKDEVQQFGPPGFPVQ
jgi:hypothetical protein